MGVEKKGLDDTELEAHGYPVGSATGVELAIGPVDVRLDGALRDDQLLGDPPVRRASRLRQKHKSELAPARPQHSGCKEPLCWGRA